MPCKDIESIRHLRSQGKGDKDGGYRGEGIHQTNRGGAVDTNVGGGKGGEGRGCGHEGVSV